MRPIDQTLANRIGFIILGLTNNFAYVVMLAAAFDLLKQSSNHSSNDQSISSTIRNETTPYCNPHSTSTILLADTIPSLVLKLSYPFLLLKVATKYKAIAVALLSAISFLVTGFFKTEFLIFTGVVCASLSSGLGESTYLTNTPLYGDASLSGWSMGTGAAGLLGAMVYAVLRLVLSIEMIMIIMLVVPVSMMLAFFYIIKPITEEQTPPTGSDNINSTQVEQDRLLSREPNEYGTTVPTRPNDNQSSYRAIDSASGEFDLNAKLRSLPHLAMYFFPLLLVYFAEYFINQGLFELIYYPEITFLDHASQYTWFQVSYQLGVMISRSSLDLFKIRYLFTMSLLQTLNAILFLVHAAKLIHLPNFYTVILLIIYEGLLGGFTYTNTFYRLKTEVPKERREFSMGVVTVADTFGIVAAGLVALPVHNALCKLYN